jgi:hypothetical protein
MANLVKIALSVEDAQTLVDGISARVRELQIYLRDTEKEPGTNTEGWKKHFAIVRADCYKLQEIELLIVHNSKDQVKKGIR